MAESEASERLRRHGPNALAAQEPEPAWKRFLAQFTDLLVILLLVATAISTVLWVVERDTPLPYEALAILAIVLLNAVLGYVQEARAEAAVAALRKMGAAQATVVRDGERRSIESEAVVPGDLILIEEGDTIPADARVIQSTALQTAEAALTGESLPVGKDVHAIEQEASLGDRTNMVFSGTVATFGRGRAIVTATGMATEIGRIAGMLEAAATESTPLQQELNRVGKLLGGVVVVIAIVMIATILMVEDVRGFSALFDVLILGVALAVAAVPEGLPAVVTAVLSIGVQRMARRHAIVRRLSAVETLGSANVIASDKTGTLTKNEMTVRTVVTASGAVEFTGIGYDPVGEMRVVGGGEFDARHSLEVERALMVADRANNAALQQREGQWVVLGDPTEGALIVAAHKAGLDREDLDARLVRLGEVPFSSERKLMSTVHPDPENEDRLLVFTKGAPGVLLSRCSREVVGDQAVPLTEDRRAEILEQNDDLAGQALRTLGVAVRRVTPQFVDKIGLDVSLEEDLAYIGSVAMMDPPRDEAKDAVRLAQRAGIRTMMITGDHPRTAAVIAGELGIDSRGGVLTGADLERLTDEQLAQRVQDVSIYARVNPEHKLRIVEALKGQGLVVAMTGDGVNDAPALKTADIGVAMGISGTDVSKEAADLILTDDNFATIVAAIEEGRAIFANIRKFLRYLLSSNIGEVMTMFLGVVFAGALGIGRGQEGVVLPLLATQILFINLVTDGAPALALGVDPPEPGLMSLPPRPRGEGVITRAMWLGIFFVGAAMGAITLLVLDACLPGGLIEGSGNLKYGQTMAFTTLVLCQLFNVFNARSDSESAFRGLFSNRWLWGSVVLSLALQVVVVYAPPLQRAFSTVGLSALDWTICVAASSGVLWIREASKLVARTAA